MFVFGGFVHWVIIIHIPSFGFCLHTKVENEEKTL